MAVLQVDEVVAAGPGLPGGADEVVKLPPGAFGRRLAGDQGEDSVILAGQAIRGVALARIAEADDELHGRRLA